MGQQRTWHVLRTGVPTATGQQRWDRAYQLLLQWAATTSPQPASAERPALVLSEVSHIQPSN